MVLRIKPSFKQETILPDVLPDSGCLWVKIRQTSGFQVRSAAKPQRIAAKLDGITPIRIDQVDQGRKEGLFRRPNGQTGLVFLGHFDPETRFGFFGLGNSE